MQSGARPSISKHLRQTLEREHAEALKSERAARTFKNYRLNLPGDPVDAQPLVTAAEWARVCARPVPPAVEGRPVVGIDLGGNRSLGALRRRSGRMAALKHGRLRRGRRHWPPRRHEDQVADDSYAELVRSGGLSVDAGRAVPDVASLLARIWAWEPQWRSFPTRTARLSCIRSSGDGLA